MVGYIIQAVCVIAIFAAVCLFICHFIAIIYAARKLYHPVTMPKSALENIGVSIVKPLNGIDATSFLNLETYFLLDYPLFELLFCVETEDDPILMVLAVLVQKYPKVDHQILIGTDCIGPNPKINNMFKGFQVAKYNLVMIGDAGISVKPDTLTEMASVLTLQENVGMVHQIPWILPRPGFANLLQMIYFGTWHAKMYLSLNVLNQNCTTGMSTLMRKDVFDEAGGLQSLAKYLAEDYFMAEIFRRRGMKVRLSRLPALQNPGQNSIASFEGRQIRWWQLRFAMMPIAALIEPLSSCIPCVIAFSLFLNTLVPWINPLVWGMCMSLAWFLLDYVLLRIMIGPEKTFFSPFTYLCAWLYREASNPIIWVRSVYRWTNVEWRHRKFKLKLGGVTEDVTDSMC